MKTNETYLPLKQTSVGPFFKSTLAEIYFIIYNHKSSHFPSKPADTRNSLPFSGKAASFLVRWKDSPGPIGQAIRDKDYGFLLTAIREAKNKKAL